MTFVTSVAVIQFPLIWIRYVNNGCMRHRFMNDHDDHEDRREEWGANDYMTIGFKGDTFSASKI